MKYTLMIAKWLCLLLWLLAANSLLAQNMGIGTRAPQEKLHVAGRLRVDSLQGTGIGIVVVSPNGTLQRLSQPTDPSQVLRGDLSWGPVAGLTGGTVTNIQTGLGLTGGPITNAGTIGIVPGTTAGDVLQWNGSNWQPVQLANQLPAAATVGDVLTWSGTNWVNKQPGDPAVGNEVTDATAGGFLKRSGAGTPADPYTLGLENGINPGDVIKWTGTGWAPAKDSVGLTGFTEKDSVVGDEVKRVIDNRGLEITGAGTAADPLAVGLIAGTAAGQYLVWDGVRWSPQTLTLPTFTEKDAVIGNEITDRTDANSGLEVVGAGTDTDPKKIRIIPGAAGNPGVLTWNGTGWSVQSPSLTAVQAATGSPITVTGTGAAATPYQIGLQAGSAVNQALVWSGTAWVPATFQVVGAQGVSVTATGTAPAPINFTVGLPIGSTINNTLVWNTVTSQWEAGPPPASPGTLPPGAANQFLIHNGVTWSGQPFTANGSNGITVTGAGTTASPLNISLPAGTAANQALFWNGTAWAPGNLATNGTAPINVTGAGTTASPFVVSLAAGTAAGHVLTWNGTAWVSQAPTGAAYTGTAPVNVTGTNISLNNGTTAQDVLTWTGAAWVSQRIQLTGLRGLTATRNPAASNDWEIGFPAGTALNDVLTWNGTAWVSQAPTGAAYTGTAPVNVTGTTIGLNAGTAANQALIWNGTAWAPSLLAANGTAPINVTGAGTSASPFVIGLTPGTAPGNLLTWNGAAWVAQPPAPVVEADGVIGNELADTFDTWGLITRSGAGTALSPYKVGGVQGTANGQVLTWNASTAKWEPQLPTGGTPYTGIAPVFVNGTNQIGLNPGTAVNDVLTWNGTAWVSQAPTGATYTGTAPVNVTGTTISLNAGTAANQALIWNGTAWAPSLLAANGTLPITVSGAGTAASPFVIGLTPGTAPGNLLTWNGVSWVAQPPAPVVEVDGIIGNELTDTITGGGLAKTGAGTGVSPWLVGLKPGTTPGQVMTWNGTAWFPAMPPGNFWSITGNAGTTPATNFIGTTDAQDLVFRTNNTEKMRVLSTGNVGINIPAPTNRLHVVEGTNTTLGSAAIFGNNTTVTANPVHGVYGQTSSTGGAGAGVFGINPNTGAGVRGENSNLNGTGVFALGASSSATGTGAALTALNTNAFAGLGALILGNNITAPFYPTINPAVLSPFRNPGTGLQGGAALIANGLRLGVYGTAVSTNVADQNITGVFGEATSQNGTTGLLGLGRGGALIDQTLFGIYPTPTKVNFGAYASADNYGLLGINSDDNGTGFAGAVTGLCFNPLTPTSQGTGVIGWGEVGVAGISAGTGLGAVVAFGDPTDIAALIGIAGTPLDEGLLVVGNSTATGTKMFKIDHPLDPENKYLLHFSIESNEVLNVYRGNITLDANGEATVTLPHYFNAVNNTNCSYHLTPIGDFANLYIKEKINGLHFKIAGGKPNMEVSWVLYTERNDPVLQQYPEKRKVEVEKVGRAKGKYLTPELYGQPAEKGIIRRPAKLDKEAARKAYMESVKNSGNVSKEPLPQK